MRWVFCLFLLLMGLNAVAKSTEDLVLQTQPFKSAPQMSSPHGTLDDIRLLSFALDQGYVGFKFVDPELREKVGVRLQLLQGQVLNAPSLSAQEFCNQLGDILDEIPDNHLNAQLHHKKCSTVPDRGRRKPSVGKNLAAELARNSKNSWAMNRVSVGKTEIPVLSLFRFPPPDDSSWKEFDSEFSKALQSPALIFDLRGNGGGDDTKAFEIARKIVGDRFETPQEMKVTRKSAAAQALFLNGKLNQMFQYLGTSQRPPPSLMQEIKTLRASYEKTKKKPSSSEYEVYYFPKQKEPQKLSSYTGKVYVLMDAGCGSTGELLVLALKDSPQVTTVGENTAGYLDFGNPGTLVLPDSQVTVEVSTTYKKYRKIGALEKVGLTPDLPVEAGQDALEKVVELLKASLHK